MEAVWELAEVVESTSQIFRPNGWSDQASSTRCETYFMLFRGKAVLLVYPFTVICPCEGPDAIFSVIGPEKVLLSFIFVFGSTQED